MPTLKVVMTSIGDIIPDPTNAKQHSEQQIETIMGSITKFGFNDPIAIDQNNMIIEGHGRLEAAKRLKLKKLPVITLDHLSPAEKAAYMLAHNKITMNTGFDPERLVATFNLITEAEIDLDLTGFDQTEVNYLLTRSDPNYKHGRSVDVQSHTREINVDDDEFDHRCPRCGFEFNDEKA